MVRGRCASECLGAVADSWYGGGSVGLSRSPKPDFVVVLSCMWTIGAVVSVRLVDELEMVVYSANN